MKQKITGFHQDDQGHWVADLRCGHTQHVRHDPPWQDRPWTETKSGRDQKIGADLECKKCDEPEMKSPLNITSPVTLEGSAVSLQPLRRDHAVLFWDAAKENAEDIFRWIPYSMKTPEDFRRMVEKAFAEQERGESVVFATVERASQRVIGSTRFMNTDRVNRRVEIGSTWIAPAWQRTSINTEAKYLMLRHAFEVWNCIRVELKTDTLNEKSRNAILRIGAKQEGIFRKHLITWTGRVRDTVYFSILDTEWPQVKTRLEGRLGPRSISPSAC
ncbi:MAG: GNAT family N-acetyltransferase [Terriglobales bacterium]